MLFLLEIFILLSIFGYFVGRNRTSTMIDIITTRFREAYTWVVPPEHERLQGRTEGRTFKRESNGSVHKHNDDLYKKETLMCDENQETLKTDASSVLPSHGLICQDCSRNLNQKSQINPANHVYGAVDILKVTQHAMPQGKYDWLSYFPHLAQNWRLKKYDYQPIFNKVLNHKRLRSEIERVAKNVLRESDVDFEDEDKQYEEILKKLTDKTYRLLVDMRCTLSDALLRLTSYVLYKLLPCFLSGVVSHPAQIDMIKLAQEKMPTTPLVFLPLHRSHLDYILVTFILLNNEIRCPQVAAGDNLNIPVFGYLLRGLGAFYIKRKIDAADGSKDYIYRSLLQTYLQESIVAGHNIEFFIEGGRTRTGKPNMPKSGILSVIVEAFIDGLIDDAILVPVSVNYEKLVDGSFVHEQMGTPKKKESFTVALKSIWNIVNAKYGQMRIDFNEPFSLKELVNSFNERQNKISRPIPSARKLKTGLSTVSTASLFGIEVIDKHRVLVENIARHVVFDSSNATSVMSTNCLAFLLLNKFRNGVSMKELSMTLTELRHQVGTDRELGFNDDSESVIRRAAKLLSSNLVQQTSSNGEIFIKPILNVPNVIETAYYSNTLVPYFALDAVVVTTLATVNEGAPMALGDLVETAMVFCDILRYEFIFCKPCQDFTEQVEKSLSKLSKLGIVTRTNDEAFLKFNASQMLLSCLAPFTLTYLSVVDCLKTLVNLKKISEKDLIKLCLSHICSKVERGEITYGESISTDSVRNCFKLLEKWVVVESCTNCGVKEISLSSNYNSLTAIETIFDTIEKFVILK